MSQWHEHVAVRISLRITGMMLLASAWAEGGWLKRLVLAHPLRDATPAQMLLGAVLFASTSAGMMLAVLGAGLWKQVSVSERWAGCD